MVKIKTRLAFALAASAIAGILFTACGASTGSETATQLATSPPARAVASPTDDAQVLATRVAGSAAAKLGPTLLSTADYPPDLSVQRQGSKIVAARDVPGLTSEASAFFATVATASGDEFVSLIALPVDDETGASTALSALTPGNYLTGLTNGAPDAVTIPLDLSSAPLGSKGFGYSGSVPGQAPGRTIEGQVLGFVRGNTYVLLVHGMYAPSARDIDVATIAAAIDARLAVHRAEN